MEKVIRVGTHVRSWNKTQKEEKLHPIETLISA